MSNTNKVIELDSETSVANVIGENKVMIKFYASWCGACQATNKFYQELPKEYPQVKFYQIDVFQHRDVGKKYGIVSIPTFIYYRGKVEDEVVGADQQKVRELLNK